MDRSKGSYISVPEQIVYAAAALTDSYTTDRPTTSTGTIKIPKSLHEAMKSPERLLWLEALRKELSGHVESGVWTEVDKSSMPEGVTAAPLMYVFGIKADGTFKVRLVVRGDLTVQGIHYIEGKSAMASIEATRMLTSFAAAEDWSLHSIDFTQAFTNALVTNPHLYCSLPELPAELLGSDFGTGKCASRVGHMRRNLYGLVDAGRTFMHFLSKWMQDEMGVRFYINERCAFEWEWERQTLRGVLHVDDLLFAVSKDAIRAEFRRRLLARFKITGGEEEATKFCGIEIRRDWTAKTITLHQETFARKLMDKYAVWGDHIESTPWPVSGDSLQPSDVEATESELFDYMCVVGDLTWYSRTNPGLTWRASDLARFMQRPGKEHVDAARHVLRYIKGNLGAGLTYHGSKAVLHESYDHTNKLIAACDASFPHDGEYATSGTLVMMNGAAIAWKVRRQTTVSNTTTEAEVKACSLCVEMVRALTDLHGEMVHMPHGTVRTMIDSSGAESQIVHGMDNKACASYKRAQHYCEDAIDSAVIWLDHVPGKENPSDAFTKAIRNRAEFQLKNNILSGAVPHLFESVAVRKLLTV